MLGMGLKLEAVIGEKCVQKRERKNEGSFVTKEGREMKRKENNTVN